MFFKISVMFGKQNSSVLSREGWCIAKAGRWIFAFLLS